MYGNESFSYTSFFSGGELFAKRRKRAENWVVDDSNISQNKPSAFADKFIQEQLQIQQQFQHQQQQEQVIYIVHTKPTY